MARKRRAARKARMDVLEVFQQLSLPTGDGCLTSLFRNPILDPTASRENSGVEYRTVLTNGTGKLTFSAYAQLE